LIIVFQLNDSIIPLYKIVEGKIPFDNLEAVQGHHRCEPASDENLVMEVQLTMKGCTRCL